MHCGNFSGMLLRGYIAMSLQARNSTLSLHCLRLIDIVKQILEYRSFQWNIFSWINSINNAQTITKNTNICTFLTIPSPASLLSIRNQTFARMTSNECPDSKPNLHLGYWMWLKIRIQRDQIESSVPTSSNGGIDAHCNVVPNQLVTFGLRRQFFKLYMYTLALK